MAKKRMTGEKCLEEFFRVEASAGEDSESESSSKLSHDSEPKTRDDSLHVTYVMRCLAIS